MGKLFHYRLPEKSFFSSSGFTEKFSTNSNWRQINHGIATAAQKNNQVEEEK